jgi:hypothetical protein
LECVAERIRAKALLEWTCGKTNALSDLAVTVRLPLGSFVSLRIMARPTSDLPNDVTVYRVLNDYRTGLAFVETALDEADRETVIRNFLSGQYSSALRVVAFNAAEGWSQDVSEDVAREVLDRAYDADETLSEATKRFIDRL